MLGVVLFKVELNEMNFFEVLRFFILVRNVGDLYLVRNIVNNFEYDVFVSLYILVLIFFEIFGYF